LVEVKIGNHIIGDGHPCFIIAEAGSNHNGNLEQAKRLIDVAASSGADAVKFQLFRASKLYPKNAGVSDYLKVNKPIYDIIAEMEMPYEWLPKLAAHCLQKDILFMASAFDEDSVDQLDPYVEVFKISSYEMTHIPLIRHVAGKGKPVIISTGTADMEEVKETMNQFLHTGNETLILNQCTAAYPAPLETLNVRAITTLKSVFNVPVGLSDHSRDPLVGPLAAVAVGANLIEKHYTLSNHLPGPDHGFALEPMELKLMIQKVRETEMVLGSGEKAAHSIEAELRAFARRSIFAVRDVAAGEQFTNDNIAVLRRGKHQPGLEPRYFSGLLKHRANRNILAESTVKITDIDLGSR